MWFGRYKICEKSVSSFSIEREREREREREAD